MVSVKAIYKRDKKICWLCMRRVRRIDASRDHRRPRSLGGPDDARNLRLAHRTCNSERGSRPAWVYRNKVRARAHGATA